MKLSKLTKALIAAIKQIRKEISQDQSSKLEVSQTVSFLGSLYEKMRNAVEYRESHLVRKAAIERILRRRLLLNQKAEDFSESLVRELLWGKYLPNKSITEKKTELVTRSASRYLNLRRNVISRLENTRQINEVSNWIIELLACKIEFILAPNPINEAYTNFIYQWIKPLINLPKESNEARDILVYLALHSALNKTDEPLLRYHFINVYGEQNLFTNFWNTYRAVNGYIGNPLRNKITKYIKKQTAPFLILESLLLSSKPDRLETLLTDKTKLKERIQQICQKKYKLVNDRLRRAAIRSIIYLFLTKMLLALIFEIPADRYLAGKINLVSLGINIAFPPTLMFFIALFISTPGKDNTERITSRIIDILTLERPSSNTQSFYTKNRVSKPLLTFIFTIIYTLTFLLVFGAIIWLLSLIGFNIVSQTVFLFFLTVVSFFAYRIRQIPLEYRYNENEGILAPIFDFLLLPILAVGKRLSEEVARINIITFIFDFILEAPFKAVFEVIEEWFGFLRSKREEIV